MNNVADENDSIRDWLRRQAEAGNAFLRAFANAATMADEEHLAVLRPAIRQFMGRHPTRDNQEHE